MTSKVEIKSSEENLHSIWIYPAAKNGIPDGSGPIKLSPGKTASLHAWQSRAYHILEEPEAYWPKNEEEVASFSPHGDTEELF